MSERMTIECACERGGNCTSISACSADSILEDQADSYEDRIAEQQATIEQHHTKRSELKDRLLVEEKENERCFEEIQDLEAKVKEQQAAIERDQAKLKRVKEVGFETHPSWGCSKEFNDGWKACREQVQEAIE